LQQHFTAALVEAGRELTVDLVAKITKAAELTSLAESLRGSALRGVTDIGADDLVRVQRLADASVRALNIPSAPIKAAPSFTNLLAAERRS
jgi:hypothetical protein